jgi:hypothetical protein
LKKRLDSVRRKEKRYIVGIETGNRPGKLGAALVEVSGNGDDTVLYLRGFKSSVLAPEIVAALRTITNDEQLESEDLAGINFLVLHHLSKLYEAVIEDAGVAPGEVDLIGLKCLESGQLSFPVDPADLSDMTEHIVASHFRIAVSDGRGGFIPVEEALLKGMVSDMIDRFGLDDEVREAVTVALLANEAIFNEKAALCTGPAAECGRSTRRKAAAAKEPEAADKKKAFLCGEFYFPA